MRMKYKSKQICKRILHYYSYFHVSSLDLYFLLTVGKIKSNQFHEKVQFSTQKESKDKNRNYHFILIPKGTNSRTNFRNTNVDMSIWSLVEDSWNWNFIDFQALFTPYSLTQPESRRNAWKWPLFMSNWPDICGNDYFLREIGQIFEVFELFEYLIVWYSIFDFQLFLFESETLLFTLRVCDKMREMS